MHQQCLILYHQVYTYTTVKQNIDLAISMLILCGTTQSFIHHYPAIQTSQNYTRLCCGKQHNLGMFDVGLGKIIRIWILCLNNNNQNIFEVTIACTNMMISHSLHLNKQNIYVCQPGLPFTSMHQIQNHKPDNAIFKLLCF